MGRNIIKDSHNVNLMKWGASAEFKEQTKEIKRCGPKKGTKRAFIEEEPRTPFEALRMLLKLRQIEWANLLNTSNCSISHLERGNTVASIPLAKRMQEEARLRGIAVTLDELYQHVIPYGFVIRDGQLKRESDLIE